MREATFVISLDFELNWGVRDKLSIDDYRNNLLGGRVVIPRLLRLFEEYDIHATWATVGFLFFECREDLINACPRRRPHYANRGLCPYEHLQSIGRDEQEDPLHFAPSLIRAIASFPGQEIASHTFSHYYCQEAGQDQEAFCADLDAALQVASMRRLKLKSIVFPRNQCNSDYLQACRKRGLTVYRGTDECWFAEPDTAPYKRAVRLLDSYLPISGHRNCYRLQTLPASPLINIPSSRFLRFRGLTGFDRRLLLKRITSDLSFAATHGLLYHLWFHPHNFGRCQDEGLAFLTAVLDHVAILRRRYGMASLNMNEAGMRLADKTMGGRPIGRFARVN